MSKKNVFSFLSRAVKDDKLKEKLESTASQEEMVTVAERAGYSFSSEHVDEALEEMKRKPGFFGMLAEAAIEVFSPSEDDYPATGIQPFSGEPSSK